MSKWNPFKSASDVIQKVSRRKNPEKSKHYNLYLDALSSGSANPPVALVSKKRSMLVHKLDDSRPFLKPKNGERKPKDQELEVSLKEEHLHLPEYTKYRQYQSLLMDEGLKREKLLNAQGRFMEIEATGTLPMIQPHLQPQTLSDDLVSAYLPFVSDLLPYGKKDEAKALIQEALKGKIIVLTALQKVVAETYLAKIEAQAAT